MMRRWGEVAGWLLLLLALGGYAQWGGEARLTVAGCLARPAWCHGRELVMDARLERVTPAGAATLRELLGSRVVFHGGLTAFPPGTPLRLLGRFHRAGHFQLLKWEDLRPAYPRKYWLSLLGLTLGLGVFLGGWRLRRRPEGWRWQPRGEAVAGRPPGGEGDA